MSDTNPKVTITTSMGVITAELFADKAPISTENFLAYVDDGFFSGLIFHRVIPGFMIQGGGMDADMNPKPNRDQIKNEADNGVKNEVGTLAMARTGVVDSATSQFFINLNDNDFLNHRDTSTEGYGYAVFGKVTDGLDVVKAIGAVATGNLGPYQDVPVEPVMIESITRA